ncbi:MAG TPA: hypothetical protein V6D00_15080 [Pantanalinema sp.]
MDTLLKFSLWALYAIAPLGAISAIVVGVGLVRGHLDAKRDGA